MKEIHKSRNLTQQALATSVGATVRQIGAWERGENDLPMDFAVSIANVLRCSIDDIAGRSGFEDISTTLSSDEERLVGYYRSMSPDMQQTLIATAENFSALSGSGQIDRRGVSEQPVGSVV